MSQSSQKQMPISIKLAEKVKVEEEVDVEMVVEALEKWIEGDIYKVLVEEGSGVGVVWSVNKATGDVEEEITKCPPPLVKHLRQLIFNRERAGRYTFYFGKTIAELPNNEVPLWIQSAIELLMSRKGRKGKKPGMKQATVLKKKWRVQLAQFVMFQGKQLLFYHGALNQIIVELKKRLEEEKDTSAWARESWLHSVFMEYIVRDRWEAYDTDIVNDRRWPKAMNLNPLHPKNKMALGKFYIMSFNTFHTDGK